MKAASFAGFARRIAPLLVVACACRPDDAKKKGIQPSPIPAATPAGEPTVAGDQELRTGGSDSVPESTTGLESFDTVASADGTYLVRFAPAAGSIPLNKPFSLQVEIVPQSPQVADGIVLSVDAGMPQHSHGMNTTPMIQSLGNQRYRVRGMLLHMPGYWEIYFDVTRHGVTERAQFGITL